MFLSFQFKDYFHSKDSQLKWQLHPPLHTLQTGVKLAGGCPRLQSVENVAHFSDVIFLTIFIQRIRARWITREKQAFRAAGVLATVHSVIKEPEGLKERCSTGVESKCGMKGGKERKCLVWCILGGTVIMPRRIQAQKTQGKSFKKKHTLDMDPPLQKSTSLCTCKTI